MPHIILTPDQVQLIAQAQEPVELRDEEGNVLARVLTHGDRAAIARILANRNTHQPSYPAAEVEARLQRLDEIRQSEGMTREKMLDLLQRMRAGEKV